VGERAVPHVRKHLGQRLRTLRQQKGLSQERLARHAGLSGKFIGEVERGEKSISIDSLCHVAAALQVPLRSLIEGPAGPRGAVPSPEAERIFALVSGRRPAEVRRVYEVLQTMFGSQSRSTSPQR
jgi:transcriptional regulator with XRE-family HTH domain